MAFLKNAQPLLIFRIRSKRGFTRIYDIAVIVRLHIFQQFKCHDAVFSAADGYDSAFPASRENIREAGKSCIIALDLHKAVEIGVNAVAVEELAETAEIKLPEPLYLFVADSAALHLNERRTGAFLVAYKLDHTYRKNDVFVKSKF